MGSKRILRRKPILGFAMRGVLMIALFIFMTRKTLTKGGKDKQSCSHTLWMANLNRMLISGSWQGTTLSGYSRIWPDSRQDQKGSLPGSLPKQWATYLTGGQFQAGSAVKIPSRRKSEGGRKKVPQNGPTPGAGRN